MKRLLILLTLLASSVLKAEEIAIVISESFDVAQLNKAEVQRLFLAKTNRINDQRVNVVELKNAPYKTEFYKNISGKSPAQLRSYWTTLIFTGKAQPPKQVRSMQKLMEKLASKKAVITYLPVSAVTEEMRVLYTMKE